MLIPMRSCCRVSQPLTQAMFSAQASLRRPRKFFPRGKQELVRPASLPNMERKTGWRSWLALQLPEHAFEDEIAPALVAPLNPLAQKSAVHGHPGQVKLLDRFLIIVDGQKVRRAVHGHPDTLA